MSLQEKIGQLTEIAVADFYKGQDPKEEIRKGGVGAIMYVTNPQKINELQKVAVEAVAIADAGGDRCAVAQCAGSSV